MSAVALMASWGEVLPTVGLQRGVTRLYWCRGAGMGQFGLQCSVTRLSWCKGAGMRQWEIRAVKVWLLATIVGMAVVGIAGLF